VLVCQYEYKVNSTWLTKRCIRLFKSASAKDSCQTHEEEDWPTLGSNPAWWPTAVLLHEHLLSDPYLPTSSTKFSTIQHHHRGI